jgi:hypothetical protein
MVTELKVGSVPGPPPPPPPMAVPRRVTPASKLMTPSGSEVWKVCGVLAERVLAA